MGNACNNPPEDRQYQTYRFRESNNPECLHVLTTLFMPMPSPIRVNLYRRFAQHIQSFPNVKLWTIECALTGHSFQVTDPSNRFHLQVSCTSRLWIKENLLNILLRRLPEQAQFIAWIDADIRFFNNKWATETIEGLKRVDLLQLFEEADFLDRNSRVQFKSKSLMYYACRDKKMLRKYSQHSETYPHPGYAWAMNRSYLRQIGNLYEANIVGSGDKFMAYAALDLFEQGLQQNCKISQGFFLDCKDWASRAVPKRGYGYIQGRIQHEYHGQRQNRGYVSRWALLEKHNFDPKRDLTHNSQGVLELRPHQSRLQAGLDKYFLSRKDEPPAPVARNAQFQSRLSNRPNIAPVRPARRIVTRTMPNGQIQTYVVVGESNSELNEVGYISQEQLLPYPIAPSFDYEQSELNRCYPGQSKTEELVIEGNNDYEIINYEPAEGSGWY